MIKKYVHKHLTWIDLESPTLSETRQIMEEYGIHPLAAEELISPSLKPKIDLYENFILAIFHFPSARGNHGHIQNHEIDFLIGKNIIITTRYGVVEPLHAFSKIFEIHSSLEKSELGDHAGYLFYYMMRELYQGVMLELEIMKKNLKRIEGDIFDYRQKEMVVSISHLSRNILDIKQGMVLHQEVLGSLEEICKNFFGASFMPYMSAIVSDYYKIKVSVKHNGEFLKELRSTNDSLLSNRQNEIMKLFTILAFVTFPLSLISEVLSIPSESNPFFGHSYDFWLIVGIMVLVTIGMFSFFKYKKWL